MHVSWRCHTSFDSGVGWTVPERDLDLDSGEAGGVSNDRVVVQLLKLAQANEEMLQEANVPLQCIVRLLTRCCD